MADLKSEVRQLFGEVNAAIEKLQVVSKDRQLKEMTKRSQQPAFWNDSAAAQQTMKQITSLKEQVEPWLALEQDLKDTRQLIDLDDTTSMQVELNDQLEKLQNNFDQLKGDLKFNGRYDSHNAIVSIYAGAGGTDAQDWTQMLMRMYVRYGEKQGWQTKVLDESPGEEAGLKSVTMEIIKGAHIYGKLKGEHGVHRLVRQSPFNSAASRETSFAKVDVLPEIDEPGEVEIDEKYIKTDVFRSGGHGGQSVNTTDSAVRVTHTPTGISVAIQNERSQIQNKETAMMILRSRLAQLQLEQHAEEISQLKGPDSANEFGSQIRNYVLHPYKQVKDLRSKYETSDPEAILNGGLDKIVESYLDYSLTSAQ